MMKGRENNSGVMASKIDEGTDVNYGALTRKMAKNLHDSQMWKCNTIMKL